MGNRGRGYSDAKAARIEAAFRELEANGDVVMPIDIAALAKAARTTVTRVLHDAPWWTAEHSRRALNEVRRRGRATVVEVHGSLETVAAKGRATQAAQGWPMLRKGGGGLPFTPERSREMLARQAAEGWVHQRRASQKASLSARAKRQQLIDHIIAVAEGIRAENRPVYRAEVAEQVGMHPDQLSKMLSGIPWWRENMRASRLHVRKGRHTNLPPYTLLHRDTAGRLYYQVKMTRDGRTRRTYFVGRPEGLEAARAQVEAWTKDFDAPRVIPPTYHVSHAGNGGWSQSLEGRTFFSARMSGKPKPPTHGLVVVGELTRARIMAVLREQPGISATQVAECIGRSTSVVLIHLRRLRADGLIDAANRPIAPQPHAS